MDNQIDHLVIERFQKVAEVEEIYRRDHQYGAITYYIFTSNLAYDDTLMDHLIDQEIIILTRLSADQNQDITFRYVPFVIAPVPRRATGYSAQGLYTRYPVCLGDVRLVRDKVREYFTEERVVVGTLVMPEMGPKQFVITVFSKRNPYLTLDVLEQFDQWFISQNHQNFFHKILVRVEYE